MTRSPLRLLSPFCPFATYSYDVLVVSDATESYFPRFKSATLEMIIAQNGIAGWICTSDQATRALAACRP